MEKAGAALGMILALIVKNECHARDVLAGGAERKYHLLSSLKGG